MRSASAHPVTDYAMLIELRKALDEPSAEILKSRMLVEPDLKYDEVWNSFQQEWGVDASKQNRADWHAVKLLLTGPKEDPVTLNEWRRYQAKFTTTRSRVVDRTEAEERQLVFNQLPNKNAYYMNKITILTKQIFKS